jgi:hypothetical protein
MSKPTNSFEIARTNAVWNGFWDKMGELENPALHCPQPCKWGSSCVYRTGTGCGFVHPGEQGTALKLFEERTVEGRTQPAVVRLLGASFYERRRLGLSWPEWCARKGLPAPVPLSALAKQAPASAAAPASASQAKPVQPRVAVIKAQALVTHAMPIDASYVQGLLRQRLTEALVNATAWVVRYKKADLTAEGLNHPDCFSPLALARVLVEMKFQEMDELMRSAPSMEKLLPHILWAGKFLLGAKRSSVGNELYPQIQSALTESEPFRAEVGFMGPQFNAGKITGMLLEDLEEAEQLCQPEMQGKLTERIMEACEILKEHFKAV